MNTDEQAIRNLIDTWFTATKTGDIETVLGLMTDDVVFMVPGQEPFGKEAFASASRGMQGASFDGSSEIVELKILNDWAWMRSRLRVSITPPGGSPIMRRGYTLTILRKDSHGNWAITRDANLLGPDPASK
jgi:uncharacterized protein (TIGR02246 family)